METVNENIWLEIWFARTFELDTDAQPNAALIKWIILFGFLGHSMRRNLFIFMVALYSVCIKKKTERVASCGRRGIFLCTQQLDIKRPQIRLNQSTNNGSTCSCWPCLVENSSSQHMAIFVVVVHSSSIH